MEQIESTAARLGLAPDEVEPYGRGRAKVALSALDRLATRPQGKYVVVTGMTPTPLGEGKTVTTLGLVDALNRLGHPAIATIRQPSLGPTFGIKGGGAGSGRAQIAPTEAVNLHLTGDAYAVAAAHNLLAALVDNHLYHGNALGIEPHSISWPRVVDMSDRALRHVVIGLGGRSDGMPRQASFEITAASEVMSVLSLSSGLTDLRERLARIVVASDRHRRPVTADALEAAGAMAALLRDALRPNLLQTIEGSPAFAHTGPFGNISTGCSSVVADQLGVRLAGYVVTEAGFGTDLGFEKFCDIKCRASGLRPDAAVIVCTLRGLKAQSRRFEVATGRSLDPALGREDLAAIEAGVPNLARHIENVAQRFGLPAVVCINRFAGDSDAEAALVTKQAIALGASACVSSTAWRDGAEGGAALAEAVVAAAAKPARFRFLYDTNAPLLDKLETIATKVYGASGVDLTDDIERQVNQLRRWDLLDLPVCVAKTPFSLSADPKLVGRPEGFRVSLRDLRVAAGAGFLIAYLGDIQTMPGLPSRPAANTVDLGANGEITGLT